MRDQFWGPHARPLCKGTGPGLPSPGLTVTRSADHSLPPEATGVGLLVRQSRSLTADWSRLPRASTWGRGAVSWGRSPLACRLPPVPSEGPSYAATAKISRAGATLLSLGLDEQAIQE